MKFNQNSDETLFTDEFKIPKGTSENTRIGVFIYNGMENYSFSSGGGIGTIKDLMLSEQLRLIVLME